MCPLLSYNLRVAFYLPLECFWGYSGHLRKSDHNYCSISLQSRRFWPKENLNHFKYTLDSVSHKIGFHRVMECAAPGLCALHSGRSPDTSFKVHGGETRGLGLSSASTLFPSHLVSRFLALLLALNINPDLLFLDRPKPIEKQRPSLPKDVNFKLMFVYAPLIIQKYMLYKRMNLRVKGSVVLDRC